MAGDSNVAITPGSGASAATYQDSGNLQHQKFVLEIQGPTDPQDPVKVNSANPLPVGLIDGATYTSGTTPEVLGAAVVVSSAPSYTAGKVNALTQTPAGALNVNIEGGAISAGTVGAPSTALVSTTPIPTIAPGTSRQKVLTTASTNATLVKGSPGVILSIRLFNTSSTPRYIKFYDDASIPTPGTTTVAWTEVIPANAGNGGGDVADHGASGGIPFAAGIAFAITGGVGEGDTTNTAANDVVGVIIYK